MQLDRTLYDLFEEKAYQVKVKTLCLGLAYTAVCTSDGGLGVAYTWLENGKQACLAHDTQGFFEDRLAIDLLPGILDSIPLKRSMALALINALNHEAAGNMPQDETNQNLFDKLGVERGTRVAMVGYFGPLMKAFQARGAELEIIDKARGMGNFDRFCEKLGNWAEVLFLTSTSILNQSTEEILTHTSRDVRTVMLGPSTPLVPEAFSHVPITMLAGTVPMEYNGVLQAVRNGAGTRIIQRFSRKVYTELF
ncbi:MAG: DUF364 domain-containing protein [Desulfovermiculus sp.]